METTYLGVPIPTAEYDKNDYTYYIVDEVYGWFHGWSADAAIHNWKNRVYTKHVQDLVASGKIHPTSTADIYSCDVCGGILVDPPKHMGWHGDLTNS